MHQRRGTIAPLVLVGLLCSWSSHGAYVANPALHGLSIAMHWTETIQAYEERRNPNKSGNVEQDVRGEARVYVSEKGRVFGETKVYAGAAPGRGRRNGNGIRRQGPDDDATEDQPGAIPFPWHWTVSGSTVAGTQVFSEGARQVQARVIPAPNGAQCTLVVILGKSDGLLVRRNGRGFPEHVLSAEVKDPGCEISQGNVFQSEAQP